MAVLNNSALVGASGKGGAALLPQRSLRFNSADSSFLSRTFSAVGNRRTWTFSCWAKRTSLGTEQYLFAGIGGSPNPHMSLAWQADGSLAISPYDGGYPIAKTTAAKFRDVGAWYHFVFTIDTNNAVPEDRNRIYVNGTRITDWSGTNINASSGYEGAVNNSVLHHIGRWAPGYGYFFDGMLADIYFIDSQALTPSAFAYTDNATGRWEPKKYTGTYSGNSFYLDLSDNSAATATTLGADRSGLGNNWLPNNFSVNSSVVSYSSKLTSSNGFYSTNLPTNAFDGNTGTFAYSNNNGTLTFDATSFGITVTNSLVIGCFAGGSNATYSVKVNGTTVISGLFLPSGNFSAATNVNLASSLSKPFALSSIEIIAVSSNASAGINTLAVDGVVLVDSNGSGNDSLRDHPVSAGVDTGLGGQVSGNYPVFNPLAKNSGTTLSNGNLEAVSSGVYTTLTTIAFPPSGKYYAEFTINSTASGYPFVGIGGYNDAGINSYSNPNTGVFYTQGGALSGSVSGSGLTALSAGDIVGVAFDCATGKVWFSRNGAYVSSGNPGAGTNQTATLSANSSGLAFAASTYTNAAVAFNGGQRPFAYSAPAGFQTLCDTNLGTPTIIKPSTAMDIVLYTGNGSSKSVSGLQFSPDLVWMKSRSAVYSNHLVDVVRGGTKALVSDSTASEYTSSNYVTSFDSAGFTIGNEVGINNNNTTYVAWCFDAGANTVSNTAGSVTSQVRANPSAGFSITTYTGNGQNGSSFGHGLSATPEFFIIKSLGIGNWFVWHKSLPSNEYNLVLNSQSPQASLGAAYWYTLNSSILEMTSNAPFKSGPHVMYAWSSVNGLSSFGSYIGNGSTDGPMVTLPFRPALVMLKSSAGNTANWTIVDSKRDTNNVAKTRLFPSDSQAENTGADNIDILSNGFKLRVTEAGANASGGTYIYCAWAESPFKYARAR